MTNALPYLDASTVFDLVGWADAVTAVEQTLRDGFDPAVAAPRSIVELQHGQLLLMPAETGSAVGVKLSTVAPGNADAGLPRVQGLYVLYDAETLTPTLLLDGTALTTVRTPAVSAVAVKHLARPDASRLVVFGSGPQAWGHAEALRTVLPLTEVVVVGRDQDRASDLAQRLTAGGVDTIVGGPDAVLDADIVVCATTAREPLFDGDALREDACVVAIGSHEPSARELDAATLRRADRIVVETADVARREAGDVIQALQSTSIKADDLVELSTAITLPRPSGLSVFKGVGMGWEDLAVAQAVSDRWATRTA